MQKPGYFIHMGMIDYETAWNLQLRLVELRQKKQIPDILLLGQHPHVITVGRRQNGRANVLSEKFPIFEVERGGDATYHGPGQLVGYPIVFLEEGEQDPHRFLRLLEQAICQICEDVGVSATVKEKYTGVWTQDQHRKLASLGVALRNGVTFHGFALNVSTDLSCFAELNPCGLSSQVMTSINKERERDYNAEALVPESLYPGVVKRVGDALGREFILHPGFGSDLQEALGLARQDVALGLG